MTPEAQRIAIAEACGWEGVVHLGMRDGKPNIIGIRPGKTVWDDGRHDVPDYLNDLNAMHAAERHCLNRHTCHAFFDQLGLIAIKDWQDIDSVPSYEGDGSYFEMWVIETATAAQRAEAFLRTVGKWVES